MNYLIREDKLSVAHVWYGNDTACKMWSGGGLKSIKWSVAGENKDRRICKVCIKKQDKIVRKELVKFNASLKPKKRKKQKQTKATSSRWEKSKDFLCSWEWRTLRYEVLQELGRRCMCCGASPDDGRTVIHVDHIKPRHKYPELALIKSNLQILCGVCNQGKGAWDETDFRNCEDDYIDDAEREFQINLAHEAKMLQ